LLVSITATANTAVLSAAHAASLWLPVSPPQNLKISEKLCLFDRTVAKDCA
jgi:hypothetical protein